MKLFDRSGSAQPRTLTPASLSARLLLALGLCLGVGLVEAQVSPPSGGTAPRDIQRNTEILHDRSVRDLRGVTLPTRPWWSSEEAERPGAGAFTAFQVRAQGQSTANAYLLTYLATAAYANYGLRPILGLSQRQTDRLMSSNRLFLTEFERAVRPLFIDTANPGHPAPVFELISDNDREGYDPEAILIATADAIFVVFRGTDRVSGAQTLAGGPEWAEWLKTDFQLNMIRADQGVAGHVHAGFWNSLALIRERLGERIVAHGGREKPVWITGHSLGGAHSQLFAAYLRRAQGIAAHGVYTVASPQVGDEQFAAALRGALGPNGLQRFEFADDPATAFPPSALVQGGPLRPGYSPAGIRVYYDDLETRRWNEPNRSALEMRGLVETALFVPHVMLEDAFNSASPIRINLAAANLCFHHPEWYLHAAYNALGVRARPRMPPPRPPLPTEASMACNALSVLRANVAPWRLPEQATKAALETAQAAAEAINFTVSSLFANATGDAIRPGVYSIRPVNAQGRALSRPRQSGNGSTLALAAFDAAAAQRFEIAQVAGGYVIRSAGRFVDVAAESLLSDGGRVVLWEANMPFGGNGLNQVWHFYRVGNNRYLVRNLASGKVLDAANPQGSAVVRQWGARNGDTTQVWLIEPVR